MPRQARLDAPGTLHHVIIRGIDQRQIVDDDEDRKNFVDRMGCLGLETDTAIYAWALMSLSNPPDADQMSDLLEIRITSYKNGRVF